MEVFFSSWWNHVDITVRLMPLTWFKIVVLKVTGYKIKLLLIGYLFSISFKWTSMCLERSLVQLYTSSSYVFSSLFAVLNKENFCLDSKLDSKHIQNNYRTAGIYQTMIMLLPKKKKHFMTFSVSSVLCVQGRMK